MPPGLSQEGDVKPRRVGGGAGWRPCSLEPAWCQGPQQVLRVSQPSWDPQKRGPTPARKDHPDAKTVRGAEVLGQFFLFFFFNRFILFIYFLFFGCVGSSVAVHAISSCGEPGPPFAVVRGLLIAVTSLVAEHGLWALGSVVVRPVLCDAKARAALSSRRCFSAAPA